MIPTDKPYALLNPEGLLRYITMADCEETVWSIYLGYPTEFEIQSMKDEGWQVVPATVAWTPNERATT